MFQKWLGNQLKKPTGLVSRWVGRYMEKGNYVINDWTLSLLNIKGNESILEVGIGNGSTLNKLANQNNNGKNYGIDISKAMVKEAIKLNKNFIDNGLMEIKESEIEKMPFSDHLFDKVYTVHTIYFWNDLEQAMSETYRVLKENGTFYISIMDKTRMENIKRTENFTLFDLQEIEIALRNTNFKNITIHKKGVFYCIEAKK